MVIKVDSKRLDINVRHSGSLSGKDMYELRVILSAFRQLNLVLNVFIANNNVSTAT